MLKELSEDLNSTKKIQPETKDSLIVIKNNLQGNNSRMDEAKNQINDLEHKEAKTTNQNNKKKKEENQDGGVGRHTAPPRTTRTDRKSNGKGARHQGNRK